MVDYFEQILKENIQNVLQQIIFVNNGTKNENYAILHKYLFKDKRIRLLNIGYTSYAEALNRGLAPASAEYVTFMETYDWYEQKDGLEKWVKYSEDNDAEICGSVYCMKDMPGALAGNYRYIMDTAEDIGRFIESDFHNCIYKTEYLKENEIMFYNSTILTGFEFLTDACLKTEKRVWYKEVTYVHRDIQKPDWISTDKCKKVLEIFVKLMRLSIEKNCAYLHVKIIEILNADCRTGKSRLFETIWISK